MRSVRCYIEQRSESKKANENMGLEIPIIKYEKLEQTLHIPWINGVVGLVCRVILIYSYILKSQKFSKKSSMV